MKPDWNTQSFYMRGCCPTAALKQCSTVHTWHGNLNRIDSIVCSGSGVGFWEGGGKICTEEALTITSHQFVLSLGQKLSCRQKKDKKLSAILLASWHGLFVSGHEDSTGSTIPKSTTNSCFGGFLKPTEARGPETRCRTSHNRPAPLRARPNVNVGETR